MKVRSGWQQLALPVSTAVLLGALVIVYGNPQTRGSAAKERVRLGYFPNLTHAPALVGVQRNTFQQALGRGVGLDPKVFNAGPEEMEALLAGEIDLGFVGPSPAINTYLKSNGKALRILAGACSGGAALIARTGSGISRIGDLNGRRLAVPQLGGTQDVSARHFLNEEGLFPREKGGTVQILPAKNADILALFRRGEIDAAWVPEPWATRLIQEAGGRLVVDERNLWPDRRFATTVLVARTAFLDEHPARVKGILRAHLQTLGWLRGQPGEAQQAINSELKRLTGKPLPDAVLQAAWGRLEFTDDPLNATIVTFVQAAREIGYLPEDGPGIELVFAPEPLNNVRRALAVALR